MEILGKIIEREKKKQEHIDEKVEEIWIFSSESYFDNCLRVRITWTNWRSEPGWKPFKFETAVSQAICERLNESELRYNTGDI